MSEWINADVFYDRLKDFIDEMQEAKAASGNKNNYWYDARITAYCECLSLVRSLHTEQEPPNTMLMHTWIPVDVALPPLSIKNYDCPGDYYTLESWRVLVRHTDTTYNSGVSVAYLHYEKGRTDWVHGDEHVTLDGVAAWMPIPPYKGG